tara:strand:+ start:128 stop:457 length:330 start_codon:yes stop_codon:yes gene_type:complete
MIKIVILAYLMGTYPMATQQEFQMYGNFSTMEECKKELNLQTRMTGVYDVTHDFVLQTEAKYDWVVAACVDERTGDRGAEIYPTYDYGKPEGVDELLNTLKDATPGLNV